MGDAEQAADPRKSMIQFSKDASSSQTGKDQGRRKSNVSQANIKSLSRLKLRKSSFGYGSVPGIRPVERTSVTAIEYKRPPLQFLNTYQLSSYAPFNPHYVRREMEIIIDEHFTGHKYNEQVSPVLIITIVAAIMRAVKALNFNRYRVITVGSLAQKRAQSYNNAVSFLWDHVRDNYVDVQRTNHTCFLQVTTFGVYLD